MDDTAIATDTMEEHKTILSEVLTLLAEAGLRLRHNFTLQNFSDNDFFLIFFHAMSSLASVNVI